MFRSKQLSAENLIELCRALRYALAGGMMLRDAITMLAREGTPRVRRAAGLVAEDLKGGWSLQEALDKHGNTFPPLFRALATVGEETGHLPEVMGELEKYYLNREKLRRDFLSEITLPLVQLFAAIFVIAGLIFILGFIQERHPDREPVDALGLGLLGMDGALTFLAVVGAAMVSFVLLVRLVGFLAGRFSWLQRLIFRIPVLGPCLRALAMTRLCVSMKLVLDTRMSVLKAIRLAFAATDNTAYSAAAPEIENSIRRGNSISDSFAQVRVIPDSFRSAVAVAEESGRLPEMCAVQAESYDEEARRRLVTLNKMASVFIWLLVAAFIITAIFRIFSNVYLKAIDKELPAEGRQALKHIERSNAGIHGEVLDLKQA